MAHLTIAQKADTIGTYRQISVFLMETLARWTPLTPELEVKVLFGRHLWEVAQHADVLGARAAELRASLHYSRPPAAVFQQALDRLALLTGSAERVESVYDVCLPDLSRRLEALLGDADPLLDQPSIRIFERMRADYARLRTERDQLLAHVTLPSAAGWSAPLAAAFTNAEPIVDYRPSKEGAA